MLDNDDPLDGPRPVRMTFTTLIVLRAMLDEPDQPQYGFDLVKKTRVATGSMYPILDRLERAGWIVGEWEQLPDGEPRPARRYYRLTPEGVGHATAAIGGTVRRISPRTWRPMPGTI